MGTDTPRWTGQPGFLGFHPEIFVLMGKSDNGVSTADISHLLSCGYRDGTRRHTA